VSFADVKHQDTAVRVLRAAVAGDRLAHAYLFVGPRGVGKGLVARELTKLLFCESPRGKTADALDPCGKCSPCRRVDRGTHPDLYWFRKEEDRNDFRINLVVRGRGDGSEGGPTVIESVMLHPMEAPRTVTVLDDAELLNRTAANALLKTLEEPSPHAVLILLCADASQLPGTILSRCQWVRFAPLPEEFVARKVRESLAAKSAEPRERGKKAEPPPAPVSAEEIAFVCRFSGGSIEQARRLAGSGLYSLKRQIVTQLPEMDAAGALDMAAAIDKWAREQAKEAHVKVDSAEGHALRRRASRLALAAAASAFGDAGVLAGTGSAGRPINSDQPTTLAALAAWPAEAIGRAVGLLADAQAQIDRYVHTELATENALVQVSRLRPQVARK
jgi:DNA polymerase III delta prime subunit